jgi:predicted nucleic acid-binding protein
MNAVDTNVFVYALDNDEPAKQAKAHDLRRRQQSAITSFSAIVSLIRL